MRYDFGGLLFGGAYTWRGLFSEFYGNLSIEDLKKIKKDKKAKLKKKFSDYNSKNKNKN